MRECPFCKAPMLDSASFCPECGMATANISAPRPKSEQIASPAPAGWEREPTQGGDRQPRAHTKRVDAASVSEFIQQTDAGRRMQSGRAAEVLFILDCTKSMTGEIDAMRDAITGFADTIRSDGVRARVGLIEFRDRLIGEEQRVLRFQSGVFTDDPYEFRQQVSQLFAAGGGDEPESSLDALLLATRQPFSSGVSKVFVLVTDAPPHVPDKEARSIEEVGAAIRQAGIDQLYMVIRTTNPSSQVYLRLLETGVRGFAFDLGEHGEFRAREENFRKTLMALGKTISQGTR